jgi:glycolate oxidase iron-sulfur subunit
LRGPASDEPTPWSEGRLPLGDAIADEAYLCLGCRACESACPSGVGFGSLLEATRAEVERAGLRRGLAKRVETVALRRIVPRRRRLRWLMNGLALSQRLGLDRLAAGLLPSALRGMHALLPAIPPRRERRPLPSLLPAEGLRRGRVGLFAGCIMPELFGDVNRATARVLVRNGFDVVVPQKQGCCGALQIHAGDADFAFDLARRNMAVFQAARVDAVVVNSAGCGATLREVDAWLGDEAKGFSERVRDVCEFLDAAGLVRPRGSLELRVCYDDPCHLVHGQKVKDAPRRVLEAIPGVRLIPHDEPTSCCGAAGIYNLTHRAMSDAILDRKMRSLAEADPDVIASGNPGCLLQLRTGVRRHGMEVPVLHPVELLDQSYGRGA